MGIKDWLGGVVRSSPVTPSGPYQTSSASGIWTIQEATDLIKQGNWPTAGNIDPSLFIENLFSAYLYTGNGSTQTITNGIDLSGKGGLVWVKSRSAAYSHQLYDSGRGDSQCLFSNLTSASVSQSGYQYPQFSASGFNITSGSLNAGVGENGTTYASWTFRKQPKFFDIQTWTGDGTSSRQVSHSLGSIPGCIIIKATNNTSGWYVLHRGDGSWVQGLNLQDTRVGSAGIGSGYGAAPTASIFTLDASVGGGDTNQNGWTYVAYLFAHDAGGFGASGSDNVISCGSFTTDGSGNATVTLGYEPQWILYKESSVSGENWNIADNMRGMPVSGNVNVLNPNTSGSENTAGISVHPNATGFTFGPGWFASRTFIYIAIRRGPMKTPTTGTQIFSADIGSYLDNGIEKWINATISPDLIISKAGNLTLGSDFHDRLRGALRRLDSTDTSVETSDANSVTKFTRDNGSAGFNFGSASWRQISGAANRHYSFKRAPGFFDVVCYTGNATARSITHNLGVAPEFIIIKNRSATWDWQCRHSGFGVGQTSIQLNSTAAAGNANLITSLGDASTFSISDNGQVNGSSNNLVAYLFATCPGVSKVGSYTGTGNTLQIDCGFTTGARFVLIKRTDSTGDWYVWDTARGIVSGNDPYLLLNSTAAEVTTTDWVDTYSPGFELSSAVGNNTNINTATYIFLAIA